MSNIIRAIFNNVNDKEVFAKARYQYDYGMILRFEGAVTLPSAYEVHFALARHGEAITQIGNSEGVSVPDALFLAGKTIYAWAYLHSGEDDGYTEYMVQIPVIQRAQPSDEVPTPVQQSAIDQAIAALGVAVEQTAADVETTTEKAAEAQASAEAAAASAAEAAETAENVEENVTAARAAKAAAEAARDRAVQAETSANQSKTAAATSEANAAASATAASASAAAALTSEENANGAMMSAYSDANRADTAADTATSAKNDAVSAKNAAQSAKTSAETAASTATTKASEAAASATTASTAASTATTKAGEAATSATNAAASAQSVASSAAQITTNSEDIASLKEDLKSQIDATNNDLYKLIGNISGAWTQGGMYVTTGIEYLSSSAIRTPFIKVQPGDTIYFENPDTNLTVTVFEFASNAPTSSGVNERLNMQGITQLLNYITLGGTTNYIRLQMATGDTLKGDDVLVYTKRSVIVDSIISDRVPMNSKLYSIGNSILTGSVWINDAFNHLSTYENAPYARIAKAIGVKKSDVSHTLQSSSGLLYDAGTGDFLTTIKNTDLTAYDYVLTHLYAADLYLGSSTGLGNIYSAADDGTVAGAVISLVNYCSTNNSQLILVGIPPTGANGSDDGADIFDRVYSRGTIKKCDAVMHALANKYHFIFVDWEDLDISYKWKTYTDNNNVHFNSEVPYRIAGDYLGRQISGQEFKVVLESVNDTNNALLTEPIIPIVLEQGRLSTSGAPVASDYAIRSKDFIPVDGNRRSISVMFGNYALPTGATSLQCVIFEYSSTDPVTLVTYGEHINKDGDFTHTFDQNTVAFKVLLYYIAGNTFSITPDKGYLITPMWEKDGLPYHLVCQNKKIDEDNAVDLINRINKTDAVKNHVSYSWTGDICTIQGTAETNNSIYNIFSNTTGFPQGIGAGSVCKVQIKSSDANIRFRVVIHADTDIPVYFHESGYVSIPTNATGITFGFVTPPSVAVNGTVRVRLIACKDNVFYVQEHGVEHVSWFQFGAIVRTNGKNADPSTPNTLLRTSRYIRHDTQMIIAKPGYKFLVYVYDMDTDEYKGVASTNNDVTTSFNTWFTVFSIDRTLRNNYRIVLAKTDQSVLSEGDGDNCIFVEELLRATSDIQPMITFIDDDTSNKTLVEMYHDLFDATNYENVPNGYNLTGCYAVEAYRLLDNPTLYGLSMEATDSAYPDPSTLVVEESYTPPFNPNEQGTVLKNKLLEYEIDGFEMIYHCMYQHSFGNVAHNTIYLSDAIYHGNRSSDNIQLVRKNTLEGLRVVKSAGFANIGEHWATAYGACDKDIVSIAQMAGIKTLISTAKSGFMMVSGDGIDRYNVLRGHFNPDYADGTRTTDALINLVDYCIAHNGWAIITTHVNEWGGKEERYSTDFIRLIQYIIDSGCKIVSFSEGLEKYKGRMIND